MITLKFVLISLLCELTIKKICWPFFKVISNTFLKLEKKKKANFILIEIISHCIKKKYAF